MFNRKAFAWCILAMAMFIISFEVVNDRGIYAMGYRGIISALVLLGALIATRACAMSINNYPTKYIPEGVYRIKHAESEGLNILLALWRNPEPPTYRRAPLNEVRLFCIPFTWLSADADLSSQDSDGDLLVCSRVSGHPIITVSPAFLAQHPQAQREGLKAATAA